MPPQPGQKGTGKKSGARRSRSRNTTPSSIGGPSTLSSVTEETAFTELRIVPYQRATYDEMVEQHNGSAIPDSRALDALLDRLKRLLEAVDARHKVVYKGMSEMSHLRQERSIEIEAERRDDEHRERLRRDEEEDLARKAAKSKKKKDMKARDERPFAHGSHGFAPQDGSAQGTYRSICWALSLVAVHVSRRTLGLPR
jgi:transcriptional adapter 3